MGLLVINNDNQRNRLKYIVICSIVLILIASLRSPEWMTDTYGIDTQDYKDMFESTFNMEWNDFWQTFYMRYFMGDGDFDVGYYALNKLISIFTHEFWLFSIFANLLFFVPFGIILYRYTSNVRQIMFAFIFYVSLVQIFLLAGARQMFSVGFDLMAFLAVIDKKWLRATICFILGMTIHLSSILFLPPLFMVWYNAKPQTMKILHAISFLLFPLVLVFSNQLIVFMGDFVGMDKYASYGKKDIQGGSETFIFLIECMSLFSLLVIKKKELLVNYSIRSIYVMAPLLTFFAPLIITDGSMMRISLYYHLFLAFLMPYSIDCIRKKNEQNLIYFIAITALSALSLSGVGIQYYFFWQV